MCQLQQYHTKYATTNPSTQSDPKPQEPHAFMLLASWYRLKDMQIAPDANVQELAGQMSVEEEFASYTTTISHSGADVLAFWSVGT